MKVKVILTRKEWAVVLASLATRIKLEGSTETRAAIKLKKQIEVVDKKILGQVRMND